MTSNGQVPKSWDLETFTQLALHTRTDELFEGLPAWLYSSWGGFRAELIHSVSGGVVALFDPRSTDPRHLANERTVKEPATRNAENPWNGLGHLKLIDPQGKLNPLVNEIRTVEVLVPIDRLEKLLVAEAEIRFAGHHVAFDPGEAELYRINTETGYRQPLALELDRHGYHVGDSEVFLSGWTGEEGYAELLEKAGLVKIIETVDVPPFNALAYRVKILDAMPRTSGWLPESTFLPDHVWTQRDLDVLATCDRYDLYRDRVVTITQTDGPLRLNKPLPVGELHIRGAALDGQPTWKASFEVIDRVGIDSITDWVYIAQLSGNTQVREVEGHVVIDTMAGDAHIQRTRDAHIWTLKDHSSIDKVSGDTRILTQRGQAHITYLGDQSSVQQLMGEATIHTMSGHTQIRDLIETAHIGEMNDHARIGSMNTPNWQAIDTMNDQAVVTHLEAGTIGNRNTQPTPAEHQLYVEQHQAAISVGQQIGREL